MLTTYRFSSLIVAWKATVPTGHEGRHQIAEHEIACNPYTFASTPTTTVKKKTAQNRRLYESPQQTFQMFKWFEDLGNLYPLWGLCRLNIP